MTDLHRLHKTGLQVRVHQGPADRESLGRLLDAQQATGCPGSPRPGRPLHTFGVVVFALSDTDDTIARVHVTERDVAAIPAANLRVPRREFVAVWIAAERELRQQRGDWYAAGVAVTCRWLATATVRPTTGRWYVQWAPVTKRNASAHEELIEAEYLAAATLLFRRPVPRWLAGRPGWAEGIVDTLRWAWRREADAPLTPAARAAD